MVAAPLILTGESKNFRPKELGGGGHLSKKLNFGGAKFKGRPKILGGAYDNIVG